MVTAVPPLWCSLFSQPFLLMKYCRPVVLLWRCAFGKQFDWNSDTGGLYNLIQFNARYNVLILVSTRALERRISQWINGHRAIFIHKLRLVDVCQACKFHLCTFPHHVVLPSIIYWPKVESINAICNLFNLDYFHRCSIKVDAPESTWQILNGKLLPYFSFAIGKGKCGKGDKGAVPAQNFAQFFIYEYSNTTRPKQVWLSAKVPCLAGAWVLEATPPL